MTDLTKAQQELIGFAIKATGRTAHDIDQHGAWFRADPDPVVGAWSNFNPLDRDADAFRLAIQLRMTVEFCEAGVYNPRAAAMRASAGAEWHVALIAPERDTFATARLAITELAAHLGRIKETTT